MDYCGPKGIPHSEFLQWTEDDQQKALWWAARERHRCTGCGTHPDDWNPDLGGGPNAYEPEQQTCPGCRMRGNAEHQLEQARNNDPTAYFGTRVVLVRGGADDGGV